MIFLILILIFLFCISFLTYELMVYRNYNGLSYPKYRKLDLYIIEFNKFLMKNNIRNFDKKISLEMINKINIIMHNLNIKFWLSEGTALGFYRNNDFIDDDDDVDISFFSKDIPKMYVLLINLLDSGFNIAHIDIDRTYTKNGIHCFVTLRYNSLSLDIDVIGDNYSSAAGNNCHSKYILPYLKNFKQININGQYFHIPTSEYYKFLYGEDYMIPIKYKKPIINKI